MAGPDESAVGPGEFELIERLFAKLAGPGGLSLKDDAAILKPRSGCDLVLTKDAIAEGRHYLPDDPPGDIARKLLRVNLSDLAAKGACPRAYLLSCAWGPGIDVGWIEAFCAGLEEDQAAYHIELLGGDTIRVDGPTVLSLTAIGEVAAGQMVRRAGARIGDDVYVTGTIGDAALGLLVTTGALALASPANEALVQRYRVPEPPVSFGAILAGFAHASVDVSDGLLADLTHMCEASGVGAEIEQNAIPLSPFVQEGLRQSPDLWERILCGGDDYQTLFTASADRAAEGIAAARKTAIQVTKIGRVAAEKINLLDDSGNPATVSREGFRHF